MKQSWFIRNLIMNFVIIFALLMTEIIGWGLTSSMIAAYFLSTITTGLLFKVPVFTQYNKPPVIQNLTLGAAIYALIPATIIGVGAAEIIKIIIAFKVHEGQAIVGVVLVVNLLFATLDHAAMRIQK